MIWKDICQPNTNSTRTQSDCKHTKDYKLRVAHTHTNKDKYVCFGIMMFGRKII